MKITAHFSLWGSLVFAIMCLGYGLSGVWRIDEIADEATRSDAWGFAMFWLFLGGIGVISALVSWWMLKHDPADRP